MSKELNLNESFREYCEGVYFDSERGKPDGKVRSDGVIMECYEKIPVCPKAAVCELGVMCQLGKKIKAECKVCGNKNRCEEAGTEAALRCKRIQVVLSVEDSKKEESKVTQFPVNMDEMQRNIMISLLNARRECTEENLLTARGCVAIIDVLFYLVKNMGLPLKYIEDGKGGYFVGVDMGDPKGDWTGGLE